MWLKRKTEIKWKGGNESWAAWKTAFSPVLAPVCLSGVEGVPGTAWSWLIHSEIVTQGMEILDIMVLFDYTLQR